VTETTSHPNIRPWGTGHQVRVRPFPAVTKPTFPQALQLVGELLELRDNGVRQLPPSNDATILLGTAADKYLRRLETKGGKRGPLSVEGLRHYRYATRPWRETDPAKGAALDANGTPFALRPAAAIAAFELDDWLEDRAAVALTSARNERQGLIASLKVARSRGANVDPAAFELDPIVISRVRRSRALTAFELAWLVEAIPRRARGLVSLRGTLGLRGRESFGLLDSHIDIAGRSVFVPAALAKERRDKTLPLDETESELVHRALLERPAGSRVLFPRAEGGPWTQSKFYDHVWLPGRALAVERWQDEFGEQQTPFDGFDGRGLRRTATTLMRKAGLSPELIAARLGHKDGGALVLSTYSDAGTGERLRSELDRLGSIREAAA
jgi:integrase